jgi:hypothetical protein
VLRFDFNVTDGDTMNPIVNLNETSRH